MKENRKLSSAKTVALVGICAASLECVKLVLSFLPNIEAVTLFTAIYGYTFGPLGIAAAVVFVCVETAIYGVNTWVVLYFIYWPLVALTFMLLRRVGLKNRWIMTAIAVALTFFFGILSAFIEVGLFSGAFDRFWYRFAVYYARGIVFYALQIASNAVLFPLLFNYLTEKLEHLKPRLFGK